jgi:methionyl-tRNA formyltransferase
MSAPWRIVYMGTPETAATTLEHLLQGPDSVISVVTQPNRPSGRGQKSLASPVRKIAERHQIPVLAPEKIRDPEFLTRLRALSPDVVVVVAFGRILPKSIVDLAPHGCINVHYSLLPKYRGAAPAAWTIINGEDQGGVTTMRLVEKMDAGPLYLQEVIPLAPDETTGSLQAKLTPIGARLLLETIRRLKEGYIQPQEQNEAEATLAPMIKKEDGLIDWTQPAIAIDRRIRGFNPWPSAYTHYAGRLLKIHRAEIVTTTQTGEPGEVVRADNNGFWVATGLGILALEEVQMENKRRIAGVEFIKGARIVQGSRF